MDTRLSDRLPRLSWLIGTFVALLLIGGCAELRDVIDGDESTPVPEATTADDQADAEFATRYIGNTGGLGVSLRSDCATDARIAGGWAETTELRLLESGDGRCEGWSLVEANGATSWVAELYLVPERPTVAAVRLSAPAPPTGGGSTGTASPTPSPVPTPVPTAAPTTTGAAPTPPMVIYGPAALGDSVLIVVDGQSCKTVAAVAELQSSTGYLWLTQVQNGECNAHSGSSITFALNGAPTNEQLEWSAGGVPPDIAAGVSLTLR